MAPTLATHHTSVSAHDTQHRWLDEAMYAAEQTTDDEIVVDISAVDQVRSAELNHLIRLHLALKHQGRRLILENAQVQVWEIFTLTRLNRLIEIRDPLSKE